jgi:hypothetical protein
MDLKKKPALKSGFFYVLMFMTVTSFAQDLPVCTFQLKIEYEFI